jgi:hypothetical protein
MPIVGNIEDHCLVAAGLCQTHALACDAQALLHLFPLCCVVLHKSHIDKVEGECERLRCCGKQGQIRAASRGLKR